MTYLAAEVPGWSRENHCFSCHNNGDAARALHVARSLWSAIQQKVHEISGDYTLNTYSNITLNAGLQEPTCS